MGVVVAPMQNEFTAGVFRTLDSLTLALKHPSSLSARLLANITLLRRDALLYCSALTSSSKASLLMLPVQTDGPLFHGKITDCF